MSKDKEFTITVAPYNECVHVLIHPTLRILRRRYKTPKAYGCAFMRPAKSRDRLIGQIVLAADHLVLPAIYHEAFHLALAMFRGRRTFTTLNRAVVGDHGLEEELAYAQGGLVGTILEGLTREGLHVQ